MCAGDIGGLTPARAGVSPGSPGQAAECSAGGDSHTRPGALVAEKGESDRRDARVVDVPDRGPGVRRHPGGGGDVIRDAPERRDVRDPLVAGEVVAELPAGLGPGECERRGCGGVRAGRCLRPVTAGPVAAGPVRVAPRRSLRPAPPRPPRSAAPSSGVSRRAVLMRVRIEPAELIGKDGAHHPWREHAFKHAADPGRAVPRAVDLDSRRTALRRDRERGDRA